MEKESGECISDSGLPSISIRLIRWLLIELEIFNMGWAEDRNRGRGVVSCRLYQFSTRS